MSRRSHVQAVTTSASPAGELAGRPSCRSNRPEVRVQGAFKRNHRAQIGNGLSIHHAGQAADVDSRPSGHCTQTVTRLEHRRVARLNEIRDGHRVFGGVRSEGSNRPFSPVGKPRIGRGVTTGHGINTDVYRDCSSGIGNTKRGSKVLHVCSTPLEHSLHEAAEGADQASRLSPERGVA